MSLGVLAKSAKKYPRKIFTKWKIEKKTQPSSFDDKFNKSEHFE